MNSDRASHDTTGDGEHRDVTPTNRLDSFSDGVVVVIITIMAFVSPYLAYACDALVPLPWIVPVRRLVRQHRL